MGVNVKRYRAIVTLAKNGKCAEVLVGDVRYKIFADGRVFSYYRNRFLKLGTDKDGYKTCMLGSPALGGHYKVHLLVLTIFRRPPRIGEECRHLDGVPSHNGIGNLCWGTGVQNWQDKREHGTAAVGERHGRAKLTEAAVRYIRAHHWRGWGYKLAKKFDVSVHTIRAVWGGSIWVTS